MKKILLYVLILLILSFAGIAIYAAITQPASYRYEQKITVRAALPAIHFMLSTPSTSQMWSPWEKLDPQMKRTFSGPNTGVGAKYSWSGNRNVGSGTQTVTEAGAKQIASKLDFKSPIPGTATSEFKLDSKAHDRIEITWAFYGNNNLLGKMVSLFVDCEKMMKENQKSGLANLKAILESDANPMTKVKPGQIIQSPSAAAIQAPGKPQATSQQAPLKK